MKKLVVFDLDGTLLYTIKDICRCLNETLKKFGYKQLTVTETEKLVGYGAKNLVKDATGADGDALLEIYDDYVERQRKCDNALTVLYDGLDFVLTELKKRGVMLAVVSNKPDAVTKVVCEQKLAKYDFNYVAGANAKLYPVKPDKACLEYCLNMLKVNKSDAVYVGDSEVDALTANNADVACVSALWGYRSKEQIIMGGGKIFAETPNRLLQVLEEI